MIDQIAHINRENRVFTCKKTLPHPGNGNQSQWDYTHAYFRYLYTVLVVERSCDWILGFWRGCLVGWLGFCFVLLSFIGTWNISRSCLGNFSFREETTNIRRVGGQCVTIWQGYKTSCLRFYPKRTKDMRSSLRVFLTNLWASYGSTRICLDLYSQKKQNKSFV